MSFIMFGLYPSENIDKSLTASTSVGLQLNHTQNVRKSDCDKLNTNKTKTILEMEHLSFVNVRRKNGLLCYIRPKHLGKISHECLLRR